MPQTKRTLSGVLGGLAGLVGLSAVAGILVTATVTPVFAVTGAAAAQSIDLFEKLPSNLDVTRPMEATTIYYTDAAGNPQQLARFYDQNRIPVTFDQIATVMKDALLSSEDKNFYTHGGIDLVGTAKALVDNVRGTSSRGGSSISQQYVKNVQLEECERGVPIGDEERDAKLTACWNKAAGATGTDGIARKLQEMRYAIQIEKVYSKNDILTGYLNLANFGGTTYGIEAAANRYFGVSAANLSLSQAATLAGMVQNPNSYRIDRPDGSIYTKATDSWSNSAADGYEATLTRRNYVLDRMLKDGKITQEQYDAAHAEPITPNIQTPSQGCSSAGANAYFCQYVKATLEGDPGYFGATDIERQDKLLRGGMDVYVSMAPQSQDAATLAMQERTPPSIDGFTFGAASTVVQPNSGRVLAIAQNTIFSEDAADAAKPGYSSLVYAADAAHGASGGFSVGSTYKLFTLVDWLEKGHSLNEVLNGANRRFTMRCGDTTIPQTSDIANATGRGYTGTVLQFTKDSLNSGYLAMAEKLDLCDINKVAQRMGVTLGDGGSVTDQNVPFDVLGSKAIAPLAMASAFATIANNGLYCPPHAIDKIVGPDGAELKLPDMSCRQVIEPDIAATAAYALEQVMSDGTGTSANPYDGTPVLGKTGTHNHQQTMMIESSTAAATAVWVGQSEGDAVLDDYDAFDTNVPNVRYGLARAIQAANNAAYGGNDFPPPSSKLLRRVLVDLPNVVGMTQDDATSTLKNAGFGVTVGAPVDNAAPPGIIAAQDPPAGQVASGTTVTISPSNGNGTTVPDLTGKQPSKAVEDLQKAGFPAAMGVCTPGNGGPQGSVTSTTPAAGAAVAKGTQIVLNYSKQTCP